MIDIPLKYKIAISHIPRIGDINARKLISHFGSPEAVFSESYRNLTRIPGIGSGIARAILDRSYLTLAEEEVDYLQRNNIKSYFYLDDDYPYRLKQCDDSPVMFFFRGNCDLDGQKILSIVGTRNATAGGKELCEKIVRDLASGHPDLIIVSGLAYGIDIAAHRSALRNNLQTIGVLAHGFSTIYPAIHAPVARNILNNGGLLTDFLSGALPERNNFIKRNRIIAGISDATLIIESGIRGGALITADIAGSYNRDVMAVPGRPGDQWSAGCNDLIRKNKAALVECADDIEYLLNWRPKNDNAPVQKMVFSELDKTEKRIYELLTGEGEMTIDNIYRRLDIPVSRLSALLLNMEFRGFLKCLPGNIYRAE